MSKLMINIAATHQGQRNLISAHTTNVRGRRALLSIYGDETSGCALYELIEHTRYSCSSA
jgi:hypothetical protein